MAICRLNRGMTEPAEPITLPKRVAEKVVVESSSRQVFGVILLVYLLPVALFLIACFATAPFGSSALSAAVSILAFFCGVVPAVLYDRRIRRSGGMVFTIVQAF